MACIPSFEHLKEANRRSEAIEVRMIVMDRSKRSLRRHSAVDAGTRKEMELGSLAQGSRANQVSEAPLGMTSGLHDGAPLYSRIPLFMNHT